MKPLTEQQKKWAWIIGAVLVFVHFAPSMLASLRGMTLPWDHPPVAQSKPSPMRIAVPPPLPPIPLTAEQLEHAQMTKLLGVWTGSTVQLDRGTCKMRLELQVKPEQPNLFSGYSTRVCGNSLPFMSGRVTSRHMETSVLNQMTPVSDIFSGTAAHGAINLNLDQSIGKSPDGCQLTAFTLTPFGQSQLAATYTEDKCQGGQMVMARAR